MFFYIQLLFLFIFLGCGGDVESVKGLKKSSNTHIDIKSYADLEKLKNEAKIRSIIINRNVSKDFLKIEPLKHELSISYKVPSSITCRDIRECPILAKGSGDFYKNYTVANLSVVCNDINHMNTNDSGDNMLVIAHGVSVLEESSSILLDTNASSFPGFSYITEFIKHSDNYYKNPNKIYANITPTTYKVIEANFDLERIQNESKTRKIFIIRNVTKDYYKNQILYPKTVGTSYDISSNDITCKKISKDYIFNENIYKDSLASFPNYIIKDYRLKKHNTWCREWDSINAPDSGKTSFIITEI